jgi:hypothetical protein
LSQISIFALKQQPRHGMPDDRDPMDKRYITSQEKMLKQLRKDISDLTGDIDELADAVLNKFVAVAKSVSNESLAMQMGIGKLAAVFKDTADAATTLITNATYLEQRNKDLNKAFRINSAEAASLGESYDELAVSLGTGGDTIRNTAMRIEKELVPGMGKIIAKNTAFGKNLLMTNTLLEEHLGITGEAAANYELYATGMGQSSLGMIGATKQLADQVEAATGLSGQFESIMSEVAGLGADIQMSYKKMPGSLELAVAKAKVLGVTFKQLDATAKGFLNIEESVNNELEYQLLSGKRLVDQNNVSIAQKFREAKLAGQPLKMAEAMNDVYETQGDILEGNNYYAKEQLAKTLGMATDELMKSYQVQKLYKTGMDKDKVDKLLTMSPGDFAEAAKTMSAAQLDTFNKIKDAESQKTTDQLAKDFYGKALTEGIRVSIGTTPGSQANAIKESQDAILGADKKGGKGTFVGESAEVMKMGMNQSLASLVGSSQLIGEANGVVLKELKGLGSNIPVFGGALTAATEKLQAFSNAVFGATPTAGTTPVTPTVKKEDAVMVNDGVIQFHPADKFATVPDGAALLASTGTGQLASAVDSMTGGKTATVDPNPIARAVAAAVQQAMSGFKIEMDGYNLTKAIEFSNRSING